MIPTILADFYLELLIERPNRFCRMLKGLKLKKYCTLLERLKMIYGDKNFRGIKNEML